jgi:hypothetical protein
MPILYPPVCWEWQLSIIGDLWFSCAVVITGVVVFETERMGGNGVVAPFLVFSLVIDLSLQFISNSVLL